MKQFVEDADAPEFSDAELSAQLEKALIACGDGGRAQTSPIWRGK